jgi:hypothetical protein
MLNYRGVLMQPPIIVTEGTELHCKVDGEFIIRVENGVTTVIPQTLCFIAIPAGEAKAISNQNPIFGFKVNVSHLPRTYNFVNCMYHQFTEEIAGRLATKETHLELQDILRALKEREKIFGDVEAYTMKKAYLLEKMEAIGEWLTSDTRENQG